jgi:hypothetical protein
LVRGSKRTQKTRRSRPGADIFPWFTLSQGWSNSRAAAPPGTLMCATLLQLVGRDAPVGDPSPSLQGSASASSLQSNEAFFFFTSRWSSGRLTAYIAHPRHARQAMKPTHSSRKTTSILSSLCPRVPAPRAINTVWATGPRFMFGLRVGLR